MKIGLQIAKLEYGYGVKIWRSAMEYAKKNNIELTIFPGRNLDSPYGFDYQYNRIFKYMNKDNLDALILVSTLVSNYVDKDTFIKFCSSFNDIPIISVGLDLPGIPSIIIDNKSGIKEIVKHLVEDHDVKKIAFVKGPENNLEANERYDAYCEELHIHGIEVDERLIGYGDFTAQSVDYAIDELLRKNEKLPEAIVFANDEMAIKAMKILDKKGIKTPQMIKITGFDDINEAPNLVIPLTTVEQPQEDMGTTAMKLAVDLINGEKVEDLTVLKTVSVLRSSCGCAIQYSNVKDSIEKNIMKKIQSRNTNIVDIILSTFDVVGLSKILTIKRIPKIKNIIELFSPFYNEGENKIVENTIIFNIQEIIKIDILEGNNPNDWKYILYTIKTAIRKGYNESAYVESFENIISHCNEILSEIVAIWQRGIDYKKSEKNYILRDIIYAISSVIDIDDFAQILHEQLPKLGIKTFFLSLYENEFVHLPNTNWVIPDKIKFVTGMINGYKTYHFYSFTSSYPSNMIIPLQNKWNFTSRTLTVFPIFFREIQYGTIVFEMDDDDGFVYETLVIQISGILKTIFLFNTKEKMEDKLRETMIELEKTNKLLKDLSIKDELTGLYNRRGFLQLVNQQLNLSRQMEKTCILIFADVDGLKTINDTYGHKEGDYVICMIAEILKQAFREMDIVSRYGGDEFTILISNAGNSNFEIYDERINQLIVSTNEIINKPYKLSISMGYSVFDKSTSLWLEELVKEADLNLYKNKMAKKLLRK